MAGETIYQLVCSNRKYTARDTTNHESHPWRRDPFHVFAGCSRTFCGLDSTEYLDMGLAPKSEILANHQCCARCAKALVKRDGGPLYLAADRWDEWNRGTKRTLGPLAGLSFLKKTSSQHSWILVSRHWPHLACWSWAVMWEKVHVAGGERSCLRTYSDDRSITIQFWRRRIRLSWQQHYFIPADKYKNAAPDPMRVDAMRLHSPFRACKESRS